MRLVVRARFNHAGDSDDRRQRKAAVGGAVRDERGGGHQDVAHSTLYRWLARYQAEGEESLRDCSSRRHRSSRRTPAAVERRTLAVREQTRSSPLVVGGAVSRRRGGGRLGGWW